MVNTLSDCLKHNEMCVSAIHYTSLAFQFVCKFNKFAIKIKLKVQIDLKPGTERSFQDFYRASAIVAVTKKYALLLF